MCGIAGIVTSQPVGMDELIDAMTDTLAHRGPDDRGTAVLPGDGVALGARRLSILDIEGGHQPMWDENGDHCLVFNGEIYNFDDLRRELVGHGHRFRTDHSDTEVLVHGFEQWGKGLFRRLNGMFAIAAWSRRRQELTIARDRTGEKPLYIGRIPGGYALGSELKTLLAHPGVERNVDLAALEQFLAFDFVIGPRSILSGVQKLRAGHYAVVKPDSYVAAPYWEAKFEPTQSSEEELLYELDALLDESVRRRMVADVPVGLFLSGGLDSTTVGHYMRRHSDDVHSFSIGFDDPHFDESHYAQLAAAGLGTHHHLEIFSQQRIRDLIPRVADILDEPMGDPSIFPTYLLSTFTRGHVKVALGGDGSDELLMGYKAFLPLKVAWMLDAAPHQVRRVMAASARVLPSQLGAVPLRGIQFTRLLDRPPVHRLLMHLGSFKGDARGVLSKDVLAALPSSVFGDADWALLNGNSSRTAAEQTIAAYLAGYLQDDILVKVDRASMATSLEVRSPFLDPHVVDFLLSVPTSLKLSGTTGKVLLRRLVRGRIPNENIDRPKLGFGLPLNAWLRQSLAPLVREVLAPERIRAGGLFDEAAVGRLVDQHLRDDRDHGNKLWLLLQFELWRERWLTPYVLDTSSRSKCS